MIDRLETPDMEPLARVFADALRKEIGLDNLREVARRNADEVDGSVCHSHDFCDANMVMDLAWRSVFGREIRMPCDVEMGICTEADVDFDMRRMDRAWAIAKAKGFIF